MIVVGNANGKNNSDGSADVNDFVGYGTAVNIYGDSVTTGGGADANGQMGGTTNTNATYKTDIDLSNGGSITTYGVARPAVAVDNGGDVLIKGDGDSKTQEISVNGGTLYDGFKNTADTVKMVSPPWVLGVVGNARATNMLGKGSTMIVQDSVVYAKSWGQHYPQTPEAIHICMQSTVTSLWILHPRMQVDTVHMQSVTPRNISLDQPLTYRLT